MRTARWLAPLVLAAIAAGAAAWLFTSVGEMHDRLAKHSTGLALGFLGIAGLLAAVAGLLRGLAVFWSLEPPRSTTGESASRTWSAPRNFRRRRRKGSSTTIRDDLAKRRLPERALRASRRPPAADVPRGRLWHGLRPVKTSFDQRPARVSTSARPSR